SCRPICCRSGSRPTSSRRSCRACAKRASPTTRSARCWSRTRGATSLASTLPAEDHHACVGAAPDGVGESDARVRHLTGAARTAELPHDLDRLADGGRAERLALREQTAARVDREAARHLAAAVAHPAPAAAARADPELFGGKDLPRRIRV